MTPFNGETFDGRPVTGGGSDADLGWRVRGLGDRRRQLRGRRQPGHALAGTESCRTVEGNRVDAIVPVVEGALDVIVEVALLVSRGRWGE